jgi:endonuclease/exonuclease/phosphatase family metal-dependent hydrolase
MRFSTIGKRPARPSARLYTHNIFGRHAGWEQRREVLKTGITALEPDVLLLQETIVEDGYDQLTEFLDPAWKVAHSEARGDDGIGISIASRWPIAWTRELDLALASPRDGEFAFVTLLAAIEAPPPVGRLIVANHFPDAHVDHELQRERQAVIVARALEARVAEHRHHVVVAGDLDAEPDAGSVRFLTGKQSLDGMSVCYVNAWDAVRPGEPGLTYTPRNPLIEPGWPYQRIDHILVRCGDDGRPTLSIEACVLVGDEPVDGVWASDHFGLVADLVVRER